MIVFHNPGLIDLAAVRTMGVSVKQPGSFGYFGTGLKFAIASVLRGGGRITLWRGTEAHYFTTREEIIRGEPFNLVLMDGEPMGFTDQLGKNWEPWMVLRELGCNARDEDGDFEMTAESDRLDDVPHPFQTTFVVNWDALDTAYKDRASVFCDSEVLYRTDRLEVRAGGSPHLFYRGVRVFKLEKPSRFTYNILEQQRLTEDRSLYSRYYADVCVISALMSCEDRTVLEGALTTGKGLYEGNLDLKDEGHPPKRAFLDVVMDARERRDPHLSESAKAVLSKWLRKGIEETSSGGYYRAKDSAFNVAVSALDDLGIDLTEQVVVLVDELDGDARSIVEDDRIYLLRGLADPRQIAMELAERHIESKFYGLTDTAGFLLPLLFDRHFKLREDGKDPQDEQGNSEYALRAGEEPPEMTSEEAEAHSEVEELLDPTGEGRAAHEASLEF